jgi:hypothetical protein
MSGTGIVPSRGILRKLYEDASGPTECHPSAFWQVFLQMAFPFSEGYIVVCEFPPARGSRRRVDTVVRYYDADYNTLTSFKYTESKRDGGSAQEVEAQARDAAKTAISADRLTGVYAMTTIGTKFRVWYMDSQTERLTALQGRQVFGERSEYVDADSHQASELWEVIRLVKTSHPSRVPEGLEEQGGPVGYEASDVEPHQGQDALLGQSADEGHGYEASGYAASGQHDGPGQSYDAEYDYETTGHVATGQHAGPGQSYDAGYDYGATGSAAPDHVMSDHTAGAGSTHWSLGTPVQGGEAEQTSTWQHGADLEDDEDDEVEDHGMPEQWVQVKKISHTMRPDEYEFKDKKGRRRRTKRSDWAREGRETWVFYGGRTKYLTRHLG